MYRGWQQCFPILGISGCLHRGPAWQYEIEPEVLGEEVSVEEETVEEESVEVEEESVEVEFLEEESFEMESVEEIDIIQSALQESSVCLTVDIKEIAVLPTCGPMPEQANKWI